MGTTHKIDKNSKHCCHTLFKFNLFCEYYLVLSHLIGHSSTSETRYLNFMVRTEKYYQNNY